MAGVRVLPEVFGPNGPLNLAASLGQGAEGSVYGLVEQQDTAAKLFKDKDDCRVDKLLEMIAMDDPRLRMAGTWPRAMLTGSDGSVVGYQMEFLQGWVPLFSVYQVRSRVRILPQASWLYLIRVARNTATCVHYFHESGIVIGDLNESNVLVDSRGLARLIDVDSFQVGTHPCPVGKSELTPPELQGSLFQNRMRTAQHDLFALAVLIFQTLVFGRHPFAGRSEDDSETSLEAHIKAGHYVWTTRRPLPVSPPMDLRIDWLPPEIRELFEIAFDPKSPNRPSALAWFEALKQLESDTAVCSSVSRHVYWKGCEDCPWCRLEERWGVALFLSSERRVWKRPERWIEVDKLLEDVKAISAPKVVPPPAVHNFDKIAPANLKWFEKLGPAMFYLWLLPFQLVAIVGRGPVTYVLYAAVIGGLILALLGTGAAFRRRRLFRKGSPSPTKEFLYELAKTLRPKLEEWHNLSQVAFDSKLEELHQLAASYMDVECRAEKIRLDLVKRAHRPEIDAYLSKFSTVASGLMSNRIYGILEKAHVHTAADCTDQRLVLLNGIDSDLKRALVVWREDLVDHYLTTSTFGLTQVQANLLERKLRRETELMGKRLLAAPNELKVLVAEIEGRQREVATEVQPLLEQYESVAPLFKAYCNAGFIKVDKPEELYLNRA